MVVDGERADIPALALKGYALAERGVSAGTRPTNVEGVDFE
jgi:hypothetical protein